MPETYAAASVTNLRIPRMTLEFDPKAIEDQEEFSITIPSDDIRSARIRPEQPVNLAHIMMLHPTHFLYNATQQNEGGKIEIDAEATYTHIYFGLQALPAVVVSGSYDTIPEMRERRRSLMPRMPYLQGRQAIMKQICAITSLQYQFGVPSTEFNQEFMSAPARFSFQGGDNPEFPIFIATERFDALLGQLTDTDYAELDQATSQYLALRDPLRSPDSDAASDGQESTRRRVRLSTFVQHTAEFTEAAPGDISLQRDFLLQPGDRYAMTSHSHETANDPVLAAMVAIGSLNRLCRERGL